MLNLKDMKKYLTLALVVGMFGFFSATVFGQEDHSNNNGQYVPAPGHGYDDGVGMGPGNGNGYGHRPGDGGSAGAPLDGGLLTILAASGVSYVVARKRKKNQA